MGGRTWGRRALGAVAGLALVGGVVAVAQPASAAGERQRFIVTLTDSAEPQAVAAEHRRGGAQIDRVYEHALNGFAGAMSQADVDRLRRDRRVVRIERDGVATASGTQSGATWGLDRSDARSGLDSSYTYDHTGEGVHAYVVDTGIELGHTEFTGRTGEGYDAVTSGGTADDCNGHGTHVAGTVGGSTYGVAKSVTLHPVRVLDCNGSGTWSGVIAGLDWVAGHHVTPAVANMSLGGGANTSVDDAVRRTIDAGVTVVVAAGNGDRQGRAQDACNYSPARVTEALTIGATDKTDTKTSFSNYGTCVDLFAPGSGITSAWHTSTTATNTISGTSMAAPHVAGVAALHLDRGTSTSPAGIASDIKAVATKDIVKSASTPDNDDLLHSRTGTTEGTTPANAAPTASFTHSCTGVSCTFIDGSTDGDGSIASRSWSFGDGATSPDANPEHTYAAGGTYTVTLTVTDDDGAPGTASATVTVSEPASGGITLSARGYKVKGQQKADLTWSGATSTDVDVYRSDTEVATTPNDGAYTDNINRNGGGSYTYKVCEAGGTTTCSDPVTVTW